VLNVLFQNILLAANNKEASTPQPALDETYRNLSEFEVKFGFLLIS